MAQIKFTNFGDSTLASGIAPGDTTITLATGTGSLFPTLTGGDWFRGVIEDVTANKECIKVTARSGDVLTVDRAQEGTTALTFSVGSVVSLRLTVSSFDEYVQSLSTLYGVPSQTGNAGKVLFTNGTSTTWQAVPLPAVLIHQQFGGL